MGMLFPCHFKPLTPSVLLSMVLNLIRLFLHIQVHLILCFVSLYIYGIMLVVLVVLVILGYMQVSIVAIFVSLLIRKTVIK